MKLFGFGKSEEERATELEAKKAQDAANVEAREMGRSAGSAMTGAVNHFVTFRARPVAENIYCVFFKQISSIELDHAISPIDIARIDQKNFMTHIEDYAVRMTAECQSQVKEWLDIAEETGTRDEIDYYISTKISRISLELFERSVNRSAELIEAYQRLGFQSGPPKD